MEESRRKLICTTELQNESEWQHQASMKVGAGVAENQEIGWKSVYNTVRPLDSLSYIQSL